MKNFMRKILLSFVNLRPALKLAFGNKVIAALTGNANFPVTKPTVAEITVINTSLGAAISAASSGDTLKIAERNALEVTWSIAFVNLANDIKARAGDDEIKVQSAGFELEKSRTRNGIPDAPVEVKADTYNLTASINMSCTRSKGAYAFQYAYALINPDGSQPANLEYIMYPVSTKTKQLITGLTRGKVYAIKVMAIGSAGNSTFSDPVIVICQLRNVFCGD